MKTRKNVVDMANICQKNINPSSKIPRNPIEIPNSTLLSMNSKLPIQQMIHFKTLKLHQKVADKNLIKEGILISNVMTGKTKKIVVANC